MDRDEIAKQLVLAERLADAARAAILPYFRSSRLGTENKDASGYDPVTIADRAAEAAMRAILDQECPDDGILGEEYGHKEGSSGRTWVLDPIDGTRGFVSGTPTWGVLIALSDGQGPILGIIDQPFTGERYIGDGADAFLKHEGMFEKVTSANTQSLAEAILFTTYPEVGTEAEAHAFAQVAKAVKLTRYGLDCYAYALVASGHVDVVIEAGLNPYDIHAPIAVVESAGGIVTSWTGGPAHDGGQVIAAANVAVHAQALEILQSAMKG